MTMLTTSPRCALSTRPLAGALTEEEEEEEEEYTFES